MALTQTITPPFARQNNFLYALGKSMASSAMYPKTKLRGKNAISQALHAEVPVTGTHHHLFCHVQALQLPEAQ